VQLLLHRLEADALALDLSPHVSDVQSRRSSYVAGGGDGTLGVARSAEVNDATKVDARRNVPGLLHVAETANAGTLDLLAESAWEPTFLQQEHERESADDCKRALVRTLLTHPPRSSIW
jgi:hypothetical protein